MTFFTLEKIGKQLPELRQSVYREIAPILDFKFHDGDCPGAEQPGFDDSGWADFRLGDTWGGYDKIGWFRARVAIPLHWRGEKLALRFLPGPRDGGDSTAESLLYVNGQALQAIDVWHEEAWLPPELAQSGQIVVALRSWSGVLGVPDRRRFKLAELLVIDEAAEDFYFTAIGLHKAIQELDSNDLRRVQMLQALNDAFLQLDFSVPRSPDFYSSVAEAGRLLGGTLNAWREREEVKPGITAVGHAHIDLAWLWRLRHSREKAVRTFTTVLHLMRQYPRYRFMHSAPQAYRFLEQDSPELFERVKEKIAAGEWEITGGMWVEADINVPSGESLVRQFLLGRRYLRQRFGLESYVLWLPDVFGYSAALPQIALKSGMKYFMTTKISWSQFNRFPHDTFRWRGLDGSEMLTHFVTTPDASAWFYTYNGLLDPKDVKGLWDQYRQKELNDQLLHIFGWGDGGGGPTREMLESARVLEDLPGLPRVELGTAEPFFEGLAQRLEGKPLPVWDGELYLELHRGAYTSQAYNKRANRQAEVLYHDAEWLSTLAAVLARQPYPAGTLRDGWELILLNQFHDVLPGSSIREVYEDSREDYQAVSAIGRRVLHQARWQVLEQIAAKTDSLVAFNPLSWPRGGLLALPWSEALEAMAVTGADGQPVPGQRTETDGDLQLLFEAPPTPSLGYQAFPLVPAGAEGFDNELIVTPSRLENRYCRIELNERGQISRLYDKRQQREVLPAGERGNVFQAFEDQPMNFDAWDIDIYYQEKLREVDDQVSVEVEEAGPLRGVLRLRWRFHDSTITQRLTLYRSSARIDFRTEVDWRQQQVLLKVAFPVALRATRATYDIQFGNLERPTHWNTSWDHARFEVVGHKWVDLSEGGYGVALLNDCKYGHDVRDGVLRLTLIKSAIRPDALADQGQHDFTYSLLPHAGDWRGEVVAEAYDLNYPLLAAMAAANTDGRLPDAYQFAAVDSLAVIIETVKQSEDDDGAWVVRVYEYQQSRSSAVRLSFGQAVTRAVECNLVEEQERPVEHDESGLTFPITPYEIKTFKVWFA